MIRVAYRLARQIGAVSILALPGLTSSVASARQSPALDRFDVSVGGYYGSLDTTIGASTAKEGFQGSLNLEDDFGFRRRKTVPRVQLGLLIGDSQGFSFDYFSVNRAHDRTLAQRASHGEGNHDASATVHGKLDFDFGSAAYRWWFGDGTDVFGLGLGGAWYRVHASVRGEASVNGDFAGEASTRTNAHAWAPELQLGWRHAFNDRWRLYADASGVKKNGGRLDGHVVNAVLGVEWFPWQRLGLGADYGYSRIVLNQRKHDYDASLDMKLDGLSLFMRLRF